MPRAALESLALEAFRSRALTAAQLRRLLAFETRTQIDAFLKEHEIFDYSASDFEQDRETLRQLRVKEAQHGVGPACEFVAKQNAIRLIGHPLLINGWVIRFCRVRQLMLVGDWSGCPYNLRAHKPVVQGALAQRLNDLRSCDSILAGATA